MASTRLVLASVLELALLVLVVAAAIHGGWVAGLVALGIALTVQGVPSMLLTSRRPTSGSRLQRPH